MDIPYRQQPGIDYDKVPDGLPEIRLLHGGIPSAATSINFSYPVLPSTPDIHTITHITTNSGSDYLFGLLVELAQCRDASSWSARRLTQSCKEYVEGLDTWIRGLDFKHMTNDICDSFGFGKKGLNSLVTIRTFPIWMEHGLPYDLTVYDEDGIKFNIGVRDEKLIQNRPKRGGHSGPCPKWLQYGIIPIG